jgi:hypothetical protein
MNDIVSGMGFILVLNHLSRRRRFLGAGVRRLVINPELATTGARSLRVNVGERDMTVDEQGAACLTPIGADLL